MAQSSSPTGGRGSCLAGEVPPSTRGQGCSPGAHSLGLAFGLWFLGSLRSFLRAGEGGTGRLSTVAFGAGLVTGTMALASTMASSTITFKLAGLQGTAVVVRALFDLGSMAAGLLWFP